METEVKMNENCIRFINTSTTDTPLWRRVDVIGEKRVECVIPLNNENNIKIGDNISYSLFRKCENRLPQEYYINEKKKTVVLKWVDDTITKVKVSKDDKFDARYGFLLAYFQRHCGMSKTQANKYLDNLQKNLEKDKKEK